MIDSFEYEEIFLGSDSDQSYSKTTDCEDFDDLFESGQLFNYYSNFDSLSSDKDTGSSQ